MGTWLEDNYKEKETIEDGLTFFKDHIFQLWW